MYVYIHTYICTHVDMYIETYNTKKSPTLYMIICYSMPIIKYLLILCIRMLICTPNKNYELLSKILPTWSILTCMYYVYQNKVCTYIHN